MGEAPEIGDMDQLLIQAPVGQSPHHGQHHPVSSRPFCMGSAVAFLPCLLLSPQRASWMPSYRIPAWHHDESPTAYHKEKVDYSRVLVICAGLEHR